VTVSESSRSAVADAAVEALFAITDWQMKVSAKGYRRTSTDGTRLEFNGRPTPVLNRVIVGPDPDLDAVDDFARELSATGVPWSFQVRGDAGPRLLNLAARYGRTSSSKLPMLVWDADQVASLPASVPAGTTMRELSASEHEVYSATLAEGFGLPRAVTDMYALDRFLETPYMSAFVLDRNGEAVACGLNTLSGDQVGLYGGAVPPRHRRNGYYRALVAARLRHAVAAGARHAFTQPSPMSAPVFESLGFRPAETWTVLTSGTLSVLEPDS
jgi:GNAT superfamily N-acetyltransferase